jgi:hypothetical protein
MPLASRKIFSFASRAPKRGPEPVAFCDRFPEGLNEAVKHNFERFPPDLCSSSPPQSMQL